MTDTIEMVRRVEVTFIVPGSGVTVETYNLGRADDLVVWKLNNVATAAIQQSVKVVDRVFVHPGTARHMFRSRAGMNQFIKEKVNSIRTRKDRSND